MPVSSVTCLFTEVMAFYKAVDLVCDDYSIINTIFSGSLAGPVSRKDPAGYQFDGVKLLSDGKRDKMLAQYLKVSKARKITVFLKL